MAVTPKTEFSVLDEAVRLTARDVGELLGVHPRSIWRMVHDGRLPDPERIGHRTTRWSVGALRRSVAFGGAK